MRRLASFVAPVFTVTILSHFALGEVVKKGAVDESRYLEYRGILSDPSGGPMSGDYIIVFRLYDSSSSGLPLWEETHRVTVESGEFHVVLGRQMPLPAFAAGSRYLGVFVNGEELSPRQPLSLETGDQALRMAPPGTQLTIPPPHLAGFFDDRFVNETGDTMSGDLIVNSSVGIGTMTPGAPLDVEGSTLGGILTVANTDGGTGIISESAGDTPLWAAGIYGEGQNSSSGPAIGAWCKAMAPGTGDHYGLYSEAEGGSSGSVYGTYGTASNTSTGDAYGGYFTTSSSGSGSHTGVKSEAYANATNTVYGIDSWAANTGSGNAIAGLFQTDLDGAGQHYGVRAQAAADNSQSTFAVDGFAANYGSGDAYGGNFSTYTDGTGIHYGVYASGAGISEDAYGIYSKGENSGSAEAYGGYFQTTAYGTGTHYGLYADADCSAYSTSSLYGGYFTASSSGSGSHYGLYATGYGASSGNVRGIYAYASNTGSGEAVAGRFQVTSSGTGTHYGVYGIEAAGGTGAAVYASGDFVASGNKNAVVKTS